jgi:sugar lactone lactonase YvrE
MPPVRLLDVLGAGPEDVALDSERRLVTGVTDGRILRLCPDNAPSGPVEVIAETGGRPLGVEVDRDGTLVVCDAHRGLLRVDPGAPSPVRELIAAGEKIGGDPLNVCNNAAIAADGTIFFSDSSQRFPLEHWKADIFEHSGTGRLLRRDPDGHCQVVLDGLHFANGVALAADESFVAVAETGAYRLSRLWLAGERAGAVDRLVENLPAFPDNLSSDGGGLIWIAMGSPRNAVLDLVSPRNGVLRRALWALPSALQPKPAKTAWVAAVDATGRMVHDLQDRVRGFSTVTGVRHHQGTVWMGSLFGGTVAAFDLPDPGPAAHAPL